MVQSNTSVVPVKAGATYMLSVSIRGCFGTISLKSDSLKSEAIAQALKENGVRSKDTLPIFEATKDGKKFSLTQAGTALSTMLDGLQNRYMICSGSKRWWFVAEDDMPAINTGIEEMEQERLRLLEELHAAYDDAKNLFELRLTNILTTANRLDEFESYARKFPSWREIETEFRIELDGPVKIPSLTEVAKQEPDMQRWMKSIHEQMQRDLPKLIDDLCGTAAEFLGRLDKVDPRNLTNTQSIQLSKGQERIESLIRLHDSICQNTTFDSPVRSLIRVLLATGIFAKNSAVAAEQMREYLIDVRSSLEDNELLCGAGKGHRALYEWVHGATVEQKIKALVQELEAFRFNRVQLSEGERQAQLQALKSKAESQALLINHAAGKILAMLNELNPVLPIPSQEPPIKQAIAPDTVVSSDTNSEMLEAGF